MKIKKELIITACWLLDVLMLLIIILLPKDNNLYDVLYPLFRISIFVVPIVLIIIQVYLDYKKESINVFSSVPCLGCSLLMLLTTIRFIFTIEKNVLFQMIVILFTFVALEILIGFLMLKKDKLSVKTHLFFGIVVYISLIMFYFCSMVMSYDHSILW